MNKQEAIKKTEELEKQLAELKAIIETPDTSELVFKPHIGEEYCFVRHSGSLEEEENEGSPFDGRLIDIGNCFRTEEDARNSAKYYIMNSEYDYWFPWSGQPKPKVLPKGLEYWDENTRSWEKTLYDLCTYLIYRWKRSEQV